VNPDAEKLPDDKQNEFVHYVMQLLYLSQRGRPDIRTAISFLSTRLQSPDVDDYKKLVRVIKYLQGTVDLSLKLNSDSEGFNIRWWVDAAYAVHSNMRGHTGATMMMGNGSVYSTSSKQKMVARSSTECEMIGVYDVLPQMMWTANFLQEQGYKVDISTLYQDNTSAILLETNGRRSSTKWTRHMNIRYFYIKDQVDSNVVKIEYCITDEMFGDFFTKPLQGSKFKYMRDKIMNVDPRDKYHSDHRSVLDEIEESEGWKAKECENEECDVKTLGSELMNKKEENADDVADVEK
jgi:hypothetical protein